jgi:conjugative transposon TraK protein
MFKQLNNLDTAFKYTRILSLVTILASVGLSLTVHFSYVKESRKKDSRIFVIANGKIFEAFAEERNRLWPIQIRDHVKTFHFYFYSIQPDMTYIRKNMDKALHLADNTAAREYKNLLENGFYHAIISASISQEIECDSIEVDLNTSPWSFKYYGFQKIIRATSIVTRSLVTTGTIRMSHPTDYNPHGLTIERWKIVENKDIKTESR